MEGAGAAPHLLCEVITKRAAIAVVVFLLVSVSASAQKRAFTIEDLYRVKGLGDLELSPDARTLALTVTTSDLNASVR